MHYNHIPYSKQFNLQIIKVENETIFLKLLEHTVKNNSSDKGTVDYDPQGALLFVCVVIFFYGFSIILMICSARKRESADFGASKYVKDIAKVHQMERQQQIYKAKLALEKTTLFPTMEISSHNKMEADKNSALSLFTNDYCAKSLLRSDMERPLKQNNTRKNKIIHRNTSDILLSSNYDNATKTIDRIESAKSLPSYEGSPASSSNEMINFTTSEQTKYELAGYATQYTHPQLESDTTRCYDIPDDKPADKASFKDLVTRCYDIPDDKPADKASFKDLVTRCYDIPDDKPADKASFKDLVIENQMLTLGLYLDSKVESNLSNSNSRENCSDEPVNNCNKANINQWYVDRENECEVVRLEWIEESPKKITPLQLLPMFGSEENAKYV